MALTITIHIYYINGVTPLTYSSFAIKKYFLLLKNKVLTNYIEILSHSILLNLIKIKKKTTHFGHKESKIIHLINN